MSVKSNQPNESANSDFNLRPKIWQEYTGQERIKNNLEIIIPAARQRNESPDHILLYGNPGLGKTTLALLIAEEMNANIKTTSGPAIERPGDLAALLTNLGEKDILFIDEIHRLNKICEEVLYSSMEEFKLSIIIGKGPMAQSVELNLPHFTLIGATTKLSMLSSPLRSRFGGIFQLNFYTEKEIEKIAERSIKILKTDATQEALYFIAKRSRFTPRTANYLLKRTRDYAQVKNRKIINLETAEQALKFLEIDDKGLTLEDRKILKTLIEKFNGGPVGLKTLAVATFEEEDSILEIYEPYLMQLGFIERTPKGRVATKIAYQHLKIENRLIV